MKKRLIAIGLILGVISVFLIHNGPDTRPIEDLTFSGQSQSELQFIKNIQRKNDFGFFFLGLSFALQLAGLFTEDIKKLVNKKHDNETTTHRI